MCRVTKKAVLLGKQQSGPGQERVESIGTVSSVSIVRQLQMQVKIGIALSLAIDRAVEAFEKAATRDERCLWLGKLSELETCIPVGKAHLLWWRRIFGDD